jgi:hypothetical protein
LAANVADQRTAKVRCRKGTSIAAGKEICEAMGLGIVDCRACRQHDAAKSSPA